MNSRTHIKIQKSTIFVKKNLKIRMLHTKNIGKLEKVANIHENI